MATQDRVYLVWNPTQFGSTLRQLILNEFRNFNPFDHPTLSLTVWNGRRALLYSYTEPIAGTVHNWYIVLQSMGETAEAPARFFTGTNNILGSWQLTYDIGALADLANEKYVIETLYLDAIQLVIGGWTDATAVTYTTDYLEVITDYLTTGTYQFDITTDSETIKITDAIVLWSESNMATGGDTSFFIVAQPREQPGTTITNSLEGGSLSKIAEALENLAFRDVDVSFNNGAVVFSMRGGVRAGE